MESTHKPFHVRVSRLHAHGGHNTRDIDMRDRESWKRVIRGAKETLEQGGEHHMRPLYTDDAPAVSAPAPLKLRVEELEGGLRDMLDTWDRVCASYGWDPCHLVEVGKARDLLAKRPEVR